MFAPLKVWRKWNQKSNLKEKRHATASAIAATAVAPLVQARGHRIEDVHEIPLVLDSLNVKRTKDLVKILLDFGLGKELKRVTDSKTLRAGRGKMRNRRYTMRKGPLVVFNDDDSSVAKAARNIPGVDTCNVHRLNILKLAPGGHLGRLVVWTKSAFGALNTVFGTSKLAGQEKGGYRLQRPTLKQADIGRLINSDAV